MLGTKTNIIKDLQEVGINVVNIKVVAVVEVIKVTKKVEEDKKKGHTTRVAPLRNWLLLI